MEPVKWLPPEPISLQQARSYVHRFKHIVECAPFVGLNPNPYTAVVLLYVGIRDETLLAVFDPERASWVSIVRGPALDVIRNYPTHLPTGMALLEARYPERTFAILERRVLSPDRAPHN